MARKKDERKAIDDFGDEIKGTYAEEAARSHFRQGQLKRHLIVEAGSKFSNQLKVESGQEVIDRIKNLPKVLRDLKYKLVEYGKVALIKHPDKDAFYIGKVKEYEDYGEEKLYQLKVETKTVKVGDEDYAVYEEYQLNPANDDLNSFIVKTEIIKTSNQENISVKKFNKLLGRKFYEEFKLLKTPYIPATVFLNSYDGKSDIDGLDQIFSLERQLLKEIVRDLNLSRKKILYKSKLAAGKSKGDLEVEMTKDNIVVFEDGNALFMSPIDLWNPALALDAITKTIDWLVQYTLKMKFATKDTMATGAQKNDNQLSEINQSAQNYLEDKKEAWSETLTSFINLVYSTEVKVEFQLMTTINRIINGEQVQEEPNPPANKPKKEGEN